MLGLFGTCGMLTTIENKVKAGERIDEEECLALYQSQDINTLGRLANIVRERRHGKTAYYNHNRHINYSNVCYVKCKFCAFGVHERDAKSYRLAMDEMVALGREAARQGATELHIVGGLDPKLPYEFYPELLRNLKQAAPEVHLKAFTAVELDYFTKVGRRSLEQVICDLMEAGLGSLPGGGAEILTEPTRSQICAHKLSGDDWIDIHRTAHRLGLKSNATLLYGHIETAVDKVGHLKMIRDLQDEDSGFQTFIPLAFHPENTELDFCLPTTGMTDLKEIAIARIYLDNIPHIKVYWIMTGIRIAQLALGFGADDIDGTVVQERIVHMAGATSPQEMTVAELKKLIVEAGRVPVERDTLYNTREATHGNIQGLAQDRVAGARL